MGKRPGRHKNIVIDDDLPEWMIDSDDTCLLSVAEEAYTAKAWADKYGAGDLASCNGVYRAAMKMLDRMNDEDRSSYDRSKAGERAARKFWEAKVCARSRAG